MPTFVVAAVILCWVTLSNGAATAAVSWKRVGTVTTLTNNQMCYTDGTNVICDSSAPTIVSGLVGIGTTSPGDTLTVNGDVGYMLGTDYSTPGTQQDVNVGTTSAVRYTGASVATFQGIVAGTNGQILYLHNASNSTLTLSNQSLSESTAANRIITGTGADLPVPTQTSVTMQYDTTSARWRVTGSSNAATSLPAGSTGQVQFNLNGSAFGANANFFWDNTSSRLAIGTSAAPLSKLDVYGGVAVGTSYAGVSAAPTNGMIVQGNVGIGTATPTNNSGLNVYLGNIAPSGNTYGILLQGGGNIVDTGNYFGIYSNPTYSAPGSKTLADLYGITLNPQNTSTGTVTNMFGVQALPQNTSTGTVTTMYGLYSQCQNAGTSAGTTANCYELYLDTPVTTSPITNKYGVYQTDSSSNNYFAGNVGIGTTSPASSLQIASGAIEVPDGTGTNPSYSFNNDTGMGIFRRSAGQLAVVSDGSTWVFDNGGLVWNTNASGGRLSSSNSAGSPAFQFGGNGQTGMFDPASNTLAFSTNSTERLRIDSSGNVGIGTTSPGHPLEIVETEAGTSELPASYSNYTLTPSADELQNWSDWLSSQAAMGGTTDIPVGNTHTIGSAGGGSFQSSSETTANILYLYGVQGLTTVNTGTVQYIGGGDIEAYLKGGTTTQNITGVYSDAEVDGGTSPDLYGADLEGVVTGGTVTSATGVYTDVSGSSGTLTNLYGVYIDTDHAATNKWGLYQTDATANNYFAGAVGIGTTTPANAFDVYHTDTSTNVNYGIYSNYTLSPSSNETPSYAQSAIEGDLTIPVSSTHNTSRPIGGNFQATNSSAATIGYEMDAVHGLLTSSAGTANYLNGGYFENYLTGGTVTNGTAGLASWADVESGTASAMINGDFEGTINGGTVTDAYGVYTNIWAGSGGTITNLYGVYIATDQTATNKWGLYQDDATAKNYFAGNVGIGTASPATLLHVNGVETVGLNGGTGGQITLNGATSGNVALKVAAAAGSGTVFQLPASNGTNGYVLQTDGTGVTSWAAAPSSGFSGLTDTDFCTASGTTAIVCNTGYTGTGSVVRAASPTLTGTITAAAATFSGVITSTMATGTAPFTVASTTNVANLNASSLNGATFAAPGAIGGTTPGSGAFTTLSASSTVSGAGFSTYLASPPAIGGTAAAAGSFTTLSASSTVSGTGFSTYLASPPAIGGTSAAAGSFTTLSASSTVSGTGFSTYLASPPAIGGTAAAAGSFTTLGASGATTDTRAPAANTSIDGLILTDTTAASSGNQQYSPRLHFTGQGWKTTATAASQAVDVIQELQPVQGTTNPSGNLVWSDSINGGAYGAIMTLTSGGNLTITGTFSGSGASLTAIPESALTALSANQVLGSLTAVAPSGLSIPSCSTSASALLWTSGTGFSCNASINAAQLGGATFAAPGAIGSGTASTGAFTTLSASSTVSGAGFSTYLASPPAIGGTAAAAGNFTTLGASGAITDTQAIAATSTDGLLLTDTTAATSGNQKWSPRIHFSGRGWETNTSASQAVDMIQELQPVQGAANPSGNLTWSSSINGGAYGALMTLTTGGFVGIGTTGPTSRLQIGTDLSFAYGWPSIGFNYNITSSTYLTTNYASLIQEDYTNGGLAFFTAPSGTAGASTTSLGERMFISGSGNVGIGTTSPTAQLQIYSPYGSPIAAALGAFYSDSGFNPGYIGFNLARNEGSNTWLAGNDSAHNGGAAVMGDIFGALHFVTVASTGTSNQTPSDATILADERMTIDGSGNVGIETATPVALLDVEGGSTNTSTQYINGLFGGVQSTANTSTYYGLKTAPAYTAASGNTLTGLVGITNAPANTSTGTVTSLYGDYTAPLNNSSGTVGSMYGVLSIPTKVSTGVVTTMYGLYSRCDNKNATGAVTSCYELYLDTPTLTGAITNNYGVYQTYASAINYFAGNVGIGTTSPTTAALDVNAVANFATAGKFGATLPVYLMANNPIVGFNEYWNGSNFVFGAGSSSNYGGLISFSGTTGNFSFTASNATGNAAATATNTTLMTLTQAGNVGIGSTSPAAKLDVNGAAKIGTDSATCAAGVAGELQWTGTALQYCNGTAWTLIGTASGGTSGALSGLTGGTVANTIDNAAYAQAWTWNSLTAGTAMSLTSSTMTTGTILNLSNTATGNNAGVVLNVNNSEANAASYGIKVTSATTGAGYGVYSSLTAANTGYAVYGANAATSGTTYGVYGTNASTSGYAGYFYDTATTGSNIALYANDDSTSGRAFWANNSATTGSTITIAGTNSSTSGVSIDGNEGATSGTTIGVRGLNSSPSGYGVYGSNSATTGNAIGVFGATASTSGIGVYANATATSGTTAAVNAANATTGGGYGIFSNMSGSGNTGSAGFFQNQSTTGANYGVYASTFSTNGDGVAGAAFATSGSTNGVYGSDASPSGAGAHFSNSATTGSAYGVVADTASTSGIAGVFTASSASGTNYGIQSFAYGDSAFAGYFQAFSTTGTTYGVHAEADSTSGTALYGLEPATSGTTYGVYGTAASASGYGVYGNNASGYGVWCNGASCGGSQTWSHPSDARLKERVVDLPAQRGIDAVMRLRPVLFHWKDKKRDASEGQQIGFIAQEVQKLFPELVAADGPASAIDLGGGKKETVENTLTFKSSELVVPLVKAVQEQQQQIEDDKNEIENDKKNIAALDHRNAALDQRNIELAAQLAALQRQVSDLVSAHAH